MQTRRLSGTIHFKDLIDRVTTTEQVDEKRLPSIIVRPTGGHRADEKKYLMPTHAHLMVHDGEEVHAGDVVAKIPRATTKTKDITGGLPRVVELFEALKQRAPPVIAEINGTIRYGEVSKGLRKIHILPDMVESKSHGIQSGGEEKEYSLPRGVHINVQEGEKVKAGDPLMDGPRNRMTSSACWAKRDCSSTMCFQLLRRW